jgi:cytochrome c
MNACCIAIPVGFLAVFAVFQSEHAIAVQPQTDRTQAIEALAERSGCRRCHNVDSKSIGPAFHDIAAKYKDVAGIRGTLIEKVKKGGKGNWIDVTGGVPMPPHSGLLSEAEISRLVDWILSR